MLPDGPDHTRFRRVFMLGLRPDAPPTSLIPFAQAGPQIPQMHPLAFTTAYMPSLSGPQSAFSLDPANPPFQAHTQSVRTETPLPPGYILLFPPT